MKSGSTFVVVINSDLGVDKVDRVIFTLKGVETVVKNYPDEVNYSDGSFFVPLTQEDTIALAKNSLTNGKKVLIEAQFNFTDKSVMKSETESFFISPTLATEIVEGNTPSEYPITSINFKHEGEIIVAEVDLEKMDEKIEEEVKKYVGDIEARIDDKVDKEEGKSLIADTEIERLSEIKKEDIDSKVEKVAGKGLSTNDFTDSDVAKLNGIEAGAQKNTVTSVNNKTGVVSISKADLGLNNVNNTEDMAKPVSNAQQSAIDGALGQANGYTDKKIADLINGAPSTLDTLKEIADAMEESQEVVEALNDAIGTKANDADLQGHKNNTTIHITASERTSWNNKVDKVEGKQLSTNDFTNSYKSAIDNLPSSYAPIDAEKNVQSDWNATDLTSDTYIKNKPSIPTESTVSGWGFTKNTGTYSKPNDGIPKTDLTSSVQTSLGKADTALQSFTETDPTVPSHVKNIKSTDITSWNNKVDKVSGKSLIADTEITRLANVTNYDDTQVKKDIKSNADLIANLTSEKANKTSIFAYEQNGYLGKNYIDYQKCGNGLLNQDNGELTPNGSWITTDYIPVDGGETFTFSVESTTDNVVVRLCEYASNKGFLKNESNILLVGTSSTRTLLPNTAFVRLTFSRRNKATTMQEYLNDGHWIQMEHGNIATDYMEYVPSNVELNEAIESRFDCTHTTTERTISNASDGNIVALYLVGNTTQGANPSPSNPQPINGFSGEMGTHDNNGNESTIHTFPLYSIGDIKDELRVYSDGSGELIKRIGREVINRFDSWSSSTLRAFYNTLQENGRLDSEPINSYGVASKIWTTSKLKSAYFQFTSSDTLASVNAMLEANPIEVVYELATPTTTKLTPSEVSEILKLKTYATKTYIDAENVEFNLEYFADSEIGQSLADIKSTFLNLLQPTPTNSEQE